MLKEKTIIHHPSPKDSGKVEVLYLIRLKNWGGEGIPFASYTYSLYRWLIPTSGTWILAIPGIIFHQTLMVFFLQKIKGISPPKPKKLRHFGVSPFFSCFLRVANEFDPEKSRKIHTGLPLQCTRSKASQVNSNRRWPVISSPILGQRKKNQRIVQKTKGFWINVYSWNEPLTSNKKIVVMNFTRFMKWGLLHTKK